MEEKGKVVNIETDKDEEDLEDLIIEEDRYKGMEEETEPAHPPKGCLPISPQGRGRLKYSRILMRERPLSRP